MHFAKFILLKAPAPVSKYMLAFRTLPLHRLSRNFPGHVGQKEVEQADA